MTVPSLPDPGVRHAGTPSGEASRATERTTRRLSLRRPTLDDLEALFEIHADPETARHSPTGPLVSNRAEAKDMLLRFITDWAENGIGYWAVRPADTERVIGFGGVTLRSFSEFDGERIANLYYRFRPDVWGNGYATEVAREAVTLTRELMPETRLLALVRPTNLGSARVAEHAGLTRTITVSRDGVAMSVYELDESVSRS